MRNPLRIFTACLLSLGLALAVPLALTVPGDVYAAPGGGGGQKEKGDNKCSDGVDNDNDGLIDCNDPDCTSSNYCQGTTTSSTTSTTSTSTTTTTTEGGGTTTSTSSTTTTTTTLAQTANLEICDDGIDNNGNGDLDCADSECVEDIGCVAANAGQKAFIIPMNYELGMHCTGFEFAYCCVLPPYNSIIAQVVKTDKGGGFPDTLEADHSVGLDFLGRPTVVRDKELDANGNFKKYMLTYWHDAQPRNDDPNGKNQTSRLISNVEGNSLLMWQTVFDGADVDAGNKLIYDDYNGAQNVVQGDGTFGQAGDNYANAWLNHFYIYADLEGTIPPGVTSAEADKIRLGMPNAHIPFSTVLPDNSGPAFHPMGPGSTAGLSNVLTFSTDHGTVVFTQMKVLENLPVMLTSPRIWEALGLPLTPFEDTIDFFGDPGLVDEDSIRPYVAMKAQLHEADCVGSACTPGAAVLDDGKPVIGFGTAPIDIPNCERCHSDFSGINSAQNVNNNPDVMANVQLEMDFWNTYYAIDTGGGDSDWYSRLKGAAISILNIHDNEHGTNFMGNYPSTGFGLPQNYRLGHESVLCQRCHADNVIATVKSANCGPGSLTCEAGDLIPPLTEAIHFNHRETTELYCSAGLGGHNQCSVNADCDTSAGAGDGVCEAGNVQFADAEGRSGGCQGCHPAHRSDGGLASYPITEDGSNAFAAGDNRDAAGGCFVGRDVHSNAMKDAPGGAETPEHLNPVGQWLRNQVSSDASPNGPSGKGLWCTNCHQQFSQEMWKAENVVSLVHAEPGDPGHVREPGGTDLLDVVNAVNAARGTSYTLDQVESWIDPGSHRTTDQTHAIWAPDPGLCDHVASLFGAEPTPAQDGNVATIEVNLQSEPIVPTDCSTGVGLPGPDCDGNGNPDFSICGSLDVDGDVNVALMDFCTTQDCVDAANATLTGPGQAAVPVPFSAATDGRDHWLSPGEPHCADCHAAPYTEQSGNVNAFPPFNYPRKASLNRYSRGHQDITCQGCHESIHGLYPVTPPGMYGDKAIDETSYAQAMSMNADGSHGPLKCGACHQTNGDGVYVNPDGRVNTALDFRGTPIDNDFDAAVSWMHTYTEDVDPADFICTRCHGDNSALISSSASKWVDHAFDGRVTRDAMDKAEIASQGYVSGDPAFEDPEQTVCKGCHGDRTRSLQRRGCTTKWKNHLVEGRASEVAWVEVTANNVAGQPAADGTHCGW